MANGQSYSGAQRKIVDRYYEHFILLARPSRNSLVRPAIHVVGEELQYVYLIR